MKKLNLYKIQILLLLLFFTSCEGIIGGDGIIIDSKSKMPISGVAVHFFMDNELYEVNTSNQNGEFIGSEFVGCVPNCPDASLKFIKDGYIAKKMNFDTFWQNNTFDPNLRDNLIIELEQL